MKYIYIYILKIDMHRHTGVASERDPKIVRCLNGIAVTSWARLHTQTNEHKNDNRPFILAAAHTTTLHTILSVSLISVCVLLPRWVSLSSLLIFLIYLYNRLTWWWRRRREKNNCLFCIFEDLTGKTAYNIFSLFGYACFIVMFLFLYLSESS